MTPEELLIKLKEVSRTRTHKTLDAVYRACNDQRSRKSEDFSYAMISRVGAEYGVPTLQSLYNEGGANYRALIDSFASQTKPKSKKAVGMYAWIEELPHNESKFLTKQLLAELKQAQNKIKENFPPGKVYEVDMRTAPSPDFKFSASERRALEYLASEDFLRDRRLKKGPRGDVLGENGDQLFKPGTLPALEKALRYL